MNKIVTEFMELTGTGWGGSSDSEATIPDVELSVLLRVPRFKRNFR